MPTATDRSDCSTSCSPSANAPSRPAGDRTAAEADQRLAELAKALGHPARVQILRLLLARNSCICGDIVDELPLAQSTVSQHLKILKAAGLVQGEIDGPRVCYCVRPEGLAELKELVIGL